jgi:hypothetical protein
LSNQDFNINQKVILNNIFINKKIKNNLNQFVKLPLWCNCCCCLWYVRSPRQASNLKQLVDSEGKGKKYRASWKVIIIPLIYMEYVQVTAWQKKAQTLFSTSNELLFIRVTSSKRIKLVNLHFPQKLKVKH